MSSSGTCELVGAAVSTRGRCGERCPAAPADPAAYSRGSTVITDTLLFSYGPIG